ncbi:MAG: hypothetical protein KC435_12125 [Thermomicrobiales bacterium]|nr:hypothetical protein [Thermomicrobiales bacterium]
MATSSQTLDHLTQICRERSARGVATRADWQRLAEIDPNRARTELITYLQTNQAAPPNPYESGSGSHKGLAVGFVIGVVFMSGYWLFGDYLQREVVNSGKQWDLVTFSMYVAASMLPLFAWLGWRWDQKHAIVGIDESPQIRLRDLNWDELLAEFDATRKAGGTRMY